MIPYNTDQTQVIKWEYNKAPNLQSLIDQKSVWYNKYQDDFWTQWESNVFNINTAAPFGLMVWCVILGVPSGLFGFYTNMRSWAYGKNRQNYVYINPNDYLDQNAVNTVDPMNIGGVWSPATDGGDDQTIKVINTSDDMSIVGYWLTDPSNTGDILSDESLTYSEKVAAIQALADTPVIPDPNLIGGNFLGGGDTRNIPIEEIRKLLKLRYMTLTSDGRLNNINRMLRWIFNEGNAWDYSAKNYFYVADITVAADSATNPIGSAFSIEYRIGAGLGLSANTILYLSTPAYGFLPAGAGVKYTVVQET